MSFQGTFDITIIIIIFIVYLFTVDKRKVSHNLEKELIKSAKKEEKPQFAL